MTDKQYELFMAQHEKVMNVVKEVVSDNCWDAGIEIVSKPEGYNEQYSIVFSALSDEKIKVLMKRFKSLEWLGYLVGEIDHYNHNVYVSDIIIPKQKVSSGAVTDVDYTYQGWNIVGVIHSHHGMGAFFSGTDDAYINQNHDVSIVVSSRPGKEIKAQIRIKVTSGKYFLNENITFAVNAPVLLDIVDFHKIIDENIAVPSTQDSSGIVRPSRMSIPSYNNMSERIGFVPFDAYDEDEDDEDDEDLDELNFDEDDDGFFVNSVMRDVKKRDVRSLGTPWKPPSDNDKYSSMYVWPEDSRPDKRKGWSSSPDYSRRRAGRK